MRIRRLYSSPVLCASVVMLLVGRATLRLARAARVCSADLLDRSGAHASTPDTHGLQTAMATETRLSNNRKRGTNMASINDEQLEIQRRQTPADERRESGHPGGGQGRTDEVGHSGVQPVSIPHAPRADAVIRGMAEWGQGERGAAGYQDHGESELVAIPPRMDRPSARPPAEEPAAEPKPAEQAKLKQQPAGALTSGFLRRSRQPSG